MIRVRETKFQKLACDDEVQSPGGCVEFIPKIFCISLNEEHQRASLAADKETLSFTFSTYNFPRLFLKFL